MAIITRLEVIDWQRRLRDDSDIMSTPEFISWTRKCMHFMRFAMRVIKETQPPPPEQVRKVSAPLLCPMEFSDDD